MHITWHWQSTRNVNIGLLIHAYGMPWEASSHGFADSAIIKARCTESALTHLLLLVEQATQPPAHLHHQGDGVQFRDDPPREHVWLRKPIQRLAYYRIRLHICQDRP